MRKLFVLGLERCGTHTLAEVMKSCQNKFTVWHEHEPFLCREAFHKFNHLTSSSNNLQDKLKSLSHPNLLCECNHRFSFFIEELATIPNSTFLLLLREPLETLKSRIMNLSYIPEILHLLPVKLAEKMRSEPLHDFNRFRLRPHFAYQKAYQYYLYDLIETIRFALLQLRNLPRERYKIIHIQRLPELFVQILHMIDPEFPWDYEKAFQTSRVKHNSVYFREDNLEKESSDILEPHREEIESMFLAACTGYQMSPLYLPEFLFDPVKMMDKVL